MCAGCKQKELEVWRKENPEKRKAQDATQRLRHGEKRRANKRQWYRENQAHCLQYAVEYAAENREARNAYQTEYCRERRKVDPAFKLAGNWRNYLAKALKGKARSTHTEEILGCTWDQFEGWLEIQFQDGMSWENYGQLWEIDHVRPVSSFDLLSPIQQSKCFHYRNTQPLLKKVNRTKSNKWDGVTNAD